MTRPFGYWISKLFQDKFIARDRHDIRGFLSVQRAYISTVGTAAYFHPDANAKFAMKELHTIKQESTHPVAILSFADEFNHSNLRTVLPKFCRHFSPATKAGRTQD